MKFAWLEFFNRSHRVLSPMSPFVMVRGGFLLICFVSVASAIFKPSRFNDFLVRLDSRMSGVYWRVSNNDSSINIRAHVPGNIYSDLFREGFIPDVFMRFNDVKNRWVADEIWTYSTTFYLSKEHFSKRAANLVFHGLDTVAQIFINDRLIAGTDNMFVKYNFDIMSDVKEGMNELRVQFASPTRTARRLARRRAAPPSCPPAARRGECHANQLRKMQVAFGWDFAPAVPTVGIWKSVYLEFISGASISNILTHFELQPNHRWLVKLKVYLESPKLGFRGRLESRMTLDSGETIIKYKDVKEDKKTCMQDIMFYVKEVDVKRWWPNGFGNQTLYAVRLTFVNSVYSDEHYYKNIQIGFRTIELIEGNPTRYLGKSVGGTSGLSFYFKINGYPIYLKGITWTPVHMYPEQTYNKTLVEWALVSARNVHASILRAWGGGVYESDHFYRRCDQLGLLVWQELMFTAALYPATKEFLQSVSEEVKQNVLRLQSHPSVAIWIGNSDGEAILFDDRFKTSKRIDTYVSAYKKLFLETVKPIINQIDPERRYLSSSPSRGLLDERNGILKVDPNEQYSGDRHSISYYDTVLLAPARFVSDYGVQSLPSLYTIATSTEEVTDYKMTSKFMDHRQHVIRGNEIIVSTLETFYLEKIQEQYFGKNVFYSQIAQALAVKSETEFYRQSRLDWYTMGSIFSHLNDVWPAPSRSSIEFGGRWKMLHYFAKTFLAPVLVSPRYADDTITVYVINDRMQPIRNATGTVDTFLWNGTVPLETFEYRVEVDALYVTKYKMAFDVAESLEDRFFRFSLISQDGVQLSPFNYYFPVPLKNVRPLPLPNIEIIVRNEEPSFIFEKYNTVVISYARTLIVEVKSNAIALFLWLEASTVDGYFLENGLIMTQPLIEVPFIANTVVSPDELLKAIKYKFYLQ